VFVLVVGGGAPKLAASNGAARSECRLTMGGKGRVFGCQNTTMAELAQRLPDVAQAYFTYPLVDLTEMSGSYDFSLTWTPKNRLPRGARKNTDEASTPDGDATVFEAVEQQLGLRIEERKHPMPVVVVDRAERL